MVIKLAILLTVALLFLLCACVSRRPIGVCLSPEPCPICSPS